jgi:hypothetical protein
MHTTLDCFVASLLAMTVLAFPAVPCYRTDERYRQAPAEDFRQAGHTRRLIGSKRSPPPFSLANTGLQYVLNSETSGNIMSLNRHRA